MARVKGRKRVASGKESFRRERETEGKKTNKQERVGKRKPKKTKGCQRKQLLPTNRPTARQSPSKGSPRHPPPPGFIAEHGLLCCGIPLWGAGGRCPRCVPCQRLGPPQPARWRGSRRSRKALGAGQALLSTNSHAPGFSRLFSAQTQNRAPDELLGRT